jgi:hypothetical protein
VLSHANRLKNALFTANNVILRFFLRKTKIFQNIIKPTKKFFWPKQKNTCLMILNDKPHCQLPRILMSPRPILADSSENDPWVRSYIGWKFFLKDWNIVLPTWLDKFIASPFQSHFLFYLCRILFTKINTNQPRFSII